MTYKSNRTKLNSFLFCLSSLIVSLASIAQPLLLKKIFDNYTDINIIKEAVLSYGITIMVIIIFEYLSKVLTVKISVDIKENIRKSIVNNIQKDGYTSVTKKKQSEINVDLNTNIDSFIEAYYLNKLNIVMLLISLMFYGVAISRLDNLMVLVIFIPNIIVLLIPKMFSNKVSEKRNNIIETNENYNMKVLDFYSGINILKNLFVAPAYRSRLENESTKSIKAEKDFGILHAFIECAIGFISFMGLFLLLAYGTHKVIIGDITIGILMASFQFSELITLPMMNLTIALNTLTSGKEVMKRLNLRYGYSLIITNSPSTKPEEEFTEFESINFNDFSFSYNTEPIMNIESGTLKKGDKILITGENGCGKSTLMKLMTKELEGYSGEILVNGMELKDLSSDKINCIFSFLGQKDYIFQTSVENNIKLYSDIDITYFPEILPLVGYDEIPKDDKTSQSLSGGEKQRVSFMRTIIRDKEVLIIDEALNQIQENTRNNILKWLSRNKNLTLFYISHDSKNLAEYFNVNIRFENKKVYIKRRDDKYV